RALAVHGNLPRPVAVAGPFDVLVAPYLRRLKEIRRLHPDATLLAVLTDPERPFLDLQARAELVAALADVDFVVLPDGGEWEKAVASVAPIAVYREQETQERERQALVDHVLARYGN
ncbi:MAG: hypothetical protein ACKV22_09615, partial [Bryobacteraceae bacterium]